ncbi:hypothetical protein [Prosthecobacter dejongeii]|uniref:Uncharacterized protein n=1 Tax=Prosthecobacter dejongeii TaxID=48465 RepID=A0A7W8DSE8_9BACT|nr:hypothetical protein [Prosthecobacter dejongeii]MBB5040593.1 hypothetical protein [Prosthecobacter dejongeii]
MSALTDSLTYQAQISVPARLPEGFGLNREVRRFTETYTLAATPANGDTINLVRLPAGGNLKLVPHLSRVAHFGAASAVSISLVDSADVTLVGAVDAHTANGIAFASEDLEVAVPADGVIRAKITAHTGLAAGQTLRFFLAFVQE